MNGRKEKFSALCNRYRISILYAFGSRAKDLKKFIVRGERLFSADDYEADEMSPGKISKKVILDRISWIDRMIAGRRLP